MHMIQMKPFLTFLLGSLLVSGLSHAQGILFRTCSFEESKTMAAQEGKQIFVDAYTSWCVPCRRMSKEVFTDARVAAYFNEHYVCLKLDAEKESSHGFFKTYVPNAYPSLYWLDAEGTLLHSHCGFLSADSLLKEAHEAASDTLALRLKALESRWTAGERSPELVQAYLFDLLPRVYPQRVRPLLNEYLSALSPEELASEDVDNMVRHYARTLTDDAICRTLLKYSDHYRQHPDRQEFERIMYTLLVRIPMADKRMDSVRYASDCRLLDSINFPHKPMYLQLSGIESLLFNREYSAGLQEALAAVRHYGQDFPSLSAELCYTLIIADFFKSDYTPSPEETELCLELAGLAFCSVPSQATLAYLAAAHARRGDYRQAYELAMYLPFYGPPTLSNAVYGLLNLQRPK